MRAALLILPVVLLVACGKDEAGAPGIQGNVTTWVASVDSACLMVPNVITPDADGINDVLIPIAYWAETCTLSVHTLSLDPVFRTTQLYQGWSGLLANGQPAPSGWYFVTTRATTIGGDVLFVSHHFRLMRDPQNECLPASFDIITPDMLDPRRCGERHYPSNDIFLRCS